MGNRQRFFGQIGAIERDEDFLQLDGARVVGSGDIAGQVAAFGLQPAQAFFLGRGIAQTMAEKGEDGVENGDEEEIGPGAFTEALEEDDACGQGGEAGGNGRAAQRRPLPPGRLCLQPAQQPFGRRPAGHAEQNKHAGRINGQVNFFFCAEDEETKRHQPDFDPYRHGGDAEAVGVADDDRHVMTQL